MLVQFILSDNYPTCKECEMSVSNAHINVNFMVRMMPFRSKKLALTPVGNNCTNFFLTEMHKHSKHAHSIYNRLR